MQNWVGGKTAFTARYICPPPELVPELMDNWLAFIHSADHSPETKAIIGHCRLVTIHPFLEGNGRTARLFLDGLLEKTNGDRVPLLTYRLSPACPVKGYVEALKLLNVGDAAGFAHPFWREAIDWCDKQQVKIAAILADTQKHINNKIGLRMLSVASVRLLDHIWLQPVVCQNGLLKLFNMLFKESKAKPIIFHTTMVLALLYATFLLLFFVTDDFDYIVRFKQSLPIFLVLSLGFGFARYQYINADIEVDDEYITGPTGPKYTHWNKERVSIRIDELTDKGIGHKSAISRLLGIYRIKSHHGAGIFIVAGFYKKGMLDALRTQINKPSTADK